VGKWADRLMLIAIVIVILWFLFELVQDPSNTWEAFCGGWAAIANGG